MNRTRFAPFLFAALVLCSAALPSHAEKPAAAGWWEGSVEMPNSPLAVQIELSAGETGAWTGSIDIPVQGIRDLALAEISAEGATVGFTMKGVMGNPRFSGTISEDGRSLTGDFQHGPYTFPFALTRRDEPFPDDSALFDAYLEPGVPAEGVSGLWLGILEAGVANLRMDLTITRDEDGTLGGTINSPDQQSGDLPIDTMTLEDDLLTFNIVAIGGSFEGRVKPNGSLMIGRWSQGGAAFPISFRRQAETE